MMTERIVLEAASLQQTAAVLSREIGHQIGADDVVAVLRLLDSGNEEACDSVDLISTRRGTLPGTQVHLNVSRAAVVTAATILDLWQTNGLSLAMLSMVGYDPRVITSLSKTDGTLCNLLAIEAQLREPGASTATSVESTHNRISQRMCPHRELPCLHRIDKRCNIELETVQINIHTLAGQGCVKINSVGEVEKVL